MRAYHNDIKIKEKYLSRVLAHQQADEIIKGQYWVEGKGCAVGCTIHGPNHNRYETELGIPEWLARLEDKIFEGLPDERAMNWPLEFLDSISPGQNLELIKIPMLVFIVEFARENFNHEKYLNQLKTIDNVLSLLKADILDKKALKGAAADARKAYAAAAAYAAAYAAAAAAADADADAAADAAADARKAYAAAYAAYAAADAADAAADARKAYAAAYAAYAAADAAAARKNEYVKLADKLLELIKHYKGG